MSDFQPDEIVDVTIKGVRILGEDARGHVTIAVENGDAYPLPPQAAIERVAPAEWPPRAGDLWRRDDTKDVYFAADVHDVEDTDEVEIVMVCAYENMRLTPDGFRTRCAGRMTLVHREEACDCVHHDGHAACGADCECAS